MKKRLLLLIPLLLLTLTACGLDSPPVSNPSGPGRMVRRIEVSPHPTDGELDRVYVTQENMNALLALLRAMETDEAPLTEPDITGDQSYYTATVTFANGEQTVYHLLGHTYLRRGDGDWCVIDPESSIQFIHFLREHPTDDGSVPIETTAAPTETAAPAETTAPTE